MTTAERAQQLVPQPDLQQAAKSSTAGKPGLWPLIAYFLKLGTVGFGGPVALVGFMHRDLVEQRSWITEDTYKLSLALAQIMPGPLAAQVAIAQVVFHEAGQLVVRDATAGQPHPARLALDLHISVSAED